MASLPGRTIDPNYWGGQSAPEETDAASQWLPPSVDDLAARPATVAPVVVATAPTPPAAPPPAIPTTKGGKFRLKLAPVDEEQEEELITPKKLKSWGSSLGFHILLLLLLAFAFLTPTSRVPKTFETGLSAGDPHGSDLGQLLTGGAGIDEPLATPLIESVKTEDLSRLTVTDLSALRPELGVAPKPALGSASGGGVALTGTGQAGKGDGFGVARFGLGGTEMVNNVSVKVGNPQFTLIWDTNVDLDLHVLEPGGSHISFEYRNGRRGGELDVDDVDGQGPENIYWGGGLNKGNGPAGEYKWYVHYYGGAVSEFGRGVLNTPTRWRVRLKHNGTYKVFEGKLASAGQQSKVFSFTIDKAAGDETEAGEPMPPRRNGELDRFDNPPAQVMAPGGMTNTGSFDDPGRRRGDRPVTRRESVPDTSKTAPETKSAETKAAAAEKRVPRDELNWVIVKPEGIGFEARMPDEPIEERGTGTDVEGAPEMKSWSLNRFEGEYRVVVVDIPVDRAKGDPKVLIESLGRAEANARGGTNVKLSPSGEAAQLRLDADFDVPDRVVAGGGRARSQLVLVGRRLFRASVLGNKAFLDHADTRRFLESFKVNAEANSGK
jgi:hypothetical protein